jgi:hypothetical protein
LGADCVKSRVGTVRQGPQVATKYGQVRKGTSKCTYACNAMRRAKSKLYLHIVCADCRKQCTAMKKPSSAKQTMNPVEWREYSLV